MISVFSIISDLYLSVNGYYATNVPVEVLIFCMV